MLAIEDYAKIFHVEDGRTELARAAEIELEHLHGRDEGPGVAVRSDEVIPFDRGEIKAYLDRCIAFWRDKRKEGEWMATFYIDAFQSVRTSIFGELLPEERRGGD